MRPANPNIETLKELIALEERRAAIQGELTAVEQRISALRNSVVTGSPVKATGSSASPAKGKPAQLPQPKKGGTYRDYIMAALEAAGEAGLRVKDLALAMKTKPVNIHSWFHSNLKRIPSIKKITGGHYRIASGAKGTAASPESAPAAKAVAAPRRKKGGSKRGALSASILKHLQDAGPNGIKIADLAVQLGAKYKNVPNTASGYHPAWTTAR